MAGHLSGNAAPLILLVDDDEDSVDMYAEHLRFSGYRVITASSGEQCVSLARAHHPSVILLDIRMPLMSGSEAMNILRSDADLSDVHIVALTATAWPSVQQQAVAGGFDEVLIKPCFPDDLKTVIDRLVLNPRSPVK